MITIRVNGRSVPARAYLDGIARAKAHPDAMFKVTLHSPWPGTGAEIMEQYRRDLEKRIDERGGINVREGRVHPAVWAKASMPRAVLSRSDIHAMNRSAKRRLASRALSTSKGDEAQ